MNVRFCIHGQQSAPESNRRVDDRRSCNGAGPEFKYLHFDSCYDGRFGK